MRKVVLTLKEQKKYETIKRVVDHDGNKNRVSVELGVTVRTVNRLIAGYKNEGKAFFSHGNKGRKPITMIPDDIKKNILDLYNTKYYDCNYELFTELLKKNEDIDVSAGSVRNILMENAILSPKAHKRTRRRVKKELEAKKKASCKKHEKAEIEKKLLSIEEAHPRRPRCAYFGEEQQMDASVYTWFGDGNSYLHAAIDDATGDITGMYFDWQETLFGYYNVYHQILLRHGIPYRFNTDRRTVFEYRSLRSPDDEKDTFTQFAYACKQLGTSIVTTSVPEKKGRIERLFQTLQGRLPILFRLAGINTIEQANQYLTTYIDEFNSQFALDSNSIPSVFEAKPSEEKINLTLAVLTERIVDNGNSIKYNKCNYMTLGADGMQKLFPSKTKGLVIKAFDGSLFFSANDSVFALEKIPERFKTSPDFDDLVRKQESKPRYVPSKEHPWRVDSWKKYCKIQHHRNDDTVA